MIGWGKAAAIWRDWKKQLDETVVKASDFDYVQDEINEKNRMTILGLVSVILVLCIVMLATTFVIDAQEKHRLTFLISLLYAVGILLLVKKTSRQNRKAIMAATYLTIAGLMMYGILISYNAPEQHTVSFVGMTLIVGMMFVDRPRRIALAIAIGTILCLVMVYRHKAEAIHASDTINIVSFALLAVLGSWLIINVKVRSYMMVKHIQYLCEKDQLTDLNNRNSFERAIEGYLQKAHQTLGCLYIDVNGLHELNNTKGHKAGDEMLQFVALVLRDIFSGDDAYRIGGDEFVVFVLDVSLAEMDQKIDRMKTAISEKGYHVSIGFAYRTGDGSVQDMVESAEKQMYEDKRAFYMNNRAADRRRR